MAGTYAGAQGHGNTEERIAARPAKRLTRQTEPIMPENRGYAARHAAPSSILLPLFWIVRKFS